MSIDNKVNGSGQNDLASLLAAVERLSHRLDKIEGKNTRAGMNEIQLPHPSLDKLSVAEAIADEVFSRLSDQKACTLEANKPCDHCSMCNSRGF
jgi:hypothetical protein